MFRLQRFVDLDNNATTVVSEEVRRKMGAVLRRHHGNPSAAYGAGRSAAAIVEASREAVAKATGAETDEIVFTGSATEANNQVIKALCELLPPGRTRLLSTPIEHPSIMRSLEYLQGRGVAVEFIPVDGDGRVRLDRLEEQVDESVFLICCMLANNEIGTVQDLTSVAALAARHQVPVLADCVQALGKIPVDVKALGLQYATFSAHKLHGPKGVGALYVSRQAPMAPLLHGGHQEAGRRAGTEGVHDIAGFAEACRAVPRMLAQREQVEARKAQLLAELHRLRPDLVLNSPSEGCLPNTLSICFPGVDNALLMAALDMRGVAVAAGSACSTGENRASHVLVSIGLGEEQARETIRISLSDRTSARDLRHAVRAFRDFFEGKAPTIPVIRPSRIDETFLSNEDNYILDVRFEIERKIMKGLPNSYNASVVGFKRYVDHVPKEKNVVVVCSTGFDATAIAYSLHKRGYQRVAILLGGVAGWQIQQPKLYKRLGGSNTTRLQPRRR